jgi:NAD(P)-dependent dehydrogenase (short-subunit alcohol dehydrogenase family)
LDGKLAIVTGGNGGVGFETSKGLAERGAEVIILARSEAKSREAIRNIKIEVDCKVHFIPLDLGDIESVLTATSEIASTFSGRKIDLFVANAGIAPGSYSESSQGYESAFAVNVLGHHILLKACKNQSLLNDNAHVIAVAGDIYIMGKDSKPDYFTNKETISNAYSQSKLGLMWWTYELMQQYPDLSVNMVHPGVVASGLGGGSHGAIRNLLRQTMMLTPKAGAQTTLICATQPGIVNGGYYHNTMGRIILSEDDPAVDSQKAKEFWRLLEEISQAYIKTGPRKGETFVKN